MQKKVRAIIIKNKQVLTIARRVSGQFFWVFPGGHVEETDIDVAAALKRECLEEVSLQIEIDTHVWSRIYNGAMEDFYTCKISGGIVGPGHGPEYKNQHDSEELHAPTWIPFEQLSKIDLKPIEMRNKIIELMQVYET